jgi:acyl dehydratase
MLDRRVIGKNYPAALNEIERGAIRRFVEAVGDNNPVYRDEEAARQAGYRAIPAPPTFLATLVGGVDLVDVLGIRQRSILVGEQSFEYYQPVCVGDHVFVTSKVVDLYEKLGTGGVMDFAVIEEEGRDERGDLFYRARRTLIVRPSLRPSEVVVTSGATQAMKLAQQQQVPR